MYRQMSFWIRGVISESKEKLVAHAFLMITLYVFDMIMTLNDFLQVFTSEKPDIPNIKHSSSEITQFNDTIPQNSLHGSFRLTDQA